MPLTSRPESGPARPWTILSTALGEVLGLRFLQKYQGDAAGFWRVRFRDRDTGEERVMIIPAKNLDEQRNSSSSSTASIKRADQRSWREALRMYRRKLAPKLPLSKAAGYDDDLIRIEFCSNSAQRLFDEPPFQDVAD